MKSGKWRIGIIALAVVVAVGAVAGVALANSSPSQGSAANGFYQDFVSKLAANLGLSQSQVTSALNATKQQMLDEAVQQGKITQAQADKLASRPGLFPFGMGRGRGAGFRLGGKNNFVASALGLTPDQLKSELQSGKTLQQIITAQNMTMQQFRQKVLALQENAITHAVSAGKLTQDQANKIIQRLEQRFNNTTSPAPSGTVQS